MKIEIPVSVLTVTQKAQIVARNEKISNNPVFEMSNKYAAILGKLYGAYGDHFEISDEKLKIDNYVEVSGTRGYNEKDEYGDIIPETKPARLIAEAYATGNLVIGGAVDEIMEKVTALQARREEILKDNTRRDEIEKPIREAKEKADREARDAEYTRKKEAERQADLQRQIEKAAQHYNMIEWAQEHGSERLQKGLEQGHRCEKLYAIEHGAWLLNDSDYELDYNSHVEEKDRSCPSLAALEEVEKMKKIDGIEKAKVVWLPNGLQELHKDSEGYIEEQEDGCEAVRVDIVNISGMWYKKF